MAKLSPVYLDAQFIDGIPAVGAKVFTYIAGSTTKQTTYADSAGTIQNANPMILNARGEPVQPFWLTEGQAYKFVFTASTDTDPPTSPIRTIDNIIGVGDNTVSVDEWVITGPTPTYISATQFSLPGDQTTDFQINRRVKILVSSGTVYGYIANAVYNTLTTVTVVLDSGVLDVGINQVSLGLLRSLNPSVPSIIDTLFRIIKSTALSISARFDASLLTESRVFTFPDKNGTFATTTDISDNIENATTDPNFTSVSGTRSASPQWVNGRALIKQGTIQSTNGSPAFDFSVPAGVKRVKIKFSGNSTAGTSNPIVQLISSSGVQNSGYNAVASATQNATNGVTQSYTTGFGILSSLAANILVGEMEIENFTGNTWIAKYDISITNNQISLSGAGIVTLPAALTAVRLTVVNNADNYDAGNSGLSWEF